MTFLRCFRHSTQAHTQGNTHTLTFIGLEKAVCLNLSFHITETKDNDCVASGVGAYGTKDIHLHNSADIHLLY